MKSTTCLYGNTKLGDSLFAIHVYAWDNQRQRSARAKPIANRGKSAFPAMWKLPGSQANFSRVSKYFVLLNTPNQMEVGLKKSPHIWSNNWVKITH